MADVLRLPYGLMGSYSLFGSDTFLFRKCFKIALFYIIIMARPISEFGVQPAIEYILLIVAELFYNIYSSHLTYIVHFLASLCNS